MTAKERANAETAVAAARERVKGSYGALQGAPRILICKTEDCYGPIGGGSRGRRSYVTAAPELSHIELHSRLGLAKTCSFYE
ncbi:hypothetical protein [Rhizobium leguminosarum]|uniref:hypothetical protein n=1 Tax=Rhizobium leguminosarum TaxID=384 RepID=UPI00103BE639|nr:hypothetical protein [Rhizobium leguminosarum]TBY86252.1 hypothetical protein E0H32_03470 [Rhizobium leguminosarum bv. viciae]